MAYDYIEHSKRIEEMLVSSGHSEIAHKIRNSRLAGFTSSEILLTLRNELKVTMSNKHLSNKISSEIRNLIIEINKCNI